MSKAILSNPVARSTDPISSDLAGENDDARKGAQQAVMRILWAADFPLSDWQIFQQYSLLELGLLTQQRLRTARKELQEQGHVEPAGFQYGASETGRKAMTWTWTRKVSDEPVSYRVGPRGESQPVSDHSTDPLTPPKREVR